MNSAEAQFLKIIVTLIILSLFVMQWGKWAKPRVEDTETKRDGYFELSVLVLGVLGLGLVLHFWCGSPLSVDDGKTKCFDVGQSILCLRER